jgi:tetraacyldisaccharide 4'-kinase
VILIRILLLPFTLLYAGIILLRDVFYRWGIFSRTVFDIPVVCIGNLAVGGTGKTPHIEWLIQHLKKSCRIAVLSRGYKRKTAGYQLATFQSTPEQLGDEPFQIFRKFPEITVAVDANRVMGIPNILGDQPDTELILMDDGFQHLPLKASCYILLTDYNNLFTRDYLMPSGLLREFRSAYQRADFIIVSKCPEHIDAEEKRRIIQEIQPFSHQQVFFSSLVYGQPVHVSGPQIHLDSQTSVLAFSGIANANLFEQELKRIFETVKCIRYSDHHTYTHAELKDLNERFELLPGISKSMICTEKDAVKLQSLILAGSLKDIPLYFLPVQVKFHDHGEGILIDYIQDLVNNYRNSGSDTTLAT